MSSSDTVLIGHSLESDLLALKVPLSPPSWFPEGSWGPLFSIQEGSCGI